MYKFQQNGLKTSLSYQRTLKDWFDITVSGGAGAICLIIVYFLIAYKLSQELDWIVVIIVLVFGFVAFTQCAYFFSKLSEPTSNVIEIDKESQKVQIKLPHFKRLEIDLHELTSIECSLKREFARSHSSGGFRYWAEVDLQTKTMGKLNALTINISNIIKSSTVHPQDELLTTSKHIVDKISEEMGIHSNWTGWGKVNRKNPPRRKKRAKKR